MEFSTFVLDKNNFLHFFSIKKLGSGNQLISVICTDIVSMSDEERTSIWVFCISTEEEIFNG